MASQPYEVLVGVGKLYIADAGTAAPDLDAEPDAQDWTELGETDGGVKVTKSQNVEKYSSDQRTGNIKAVRTEEGVTIETNLNENSLEKLAYAIGGTITTVAPGSGTIGTKSLNLHRGVTVDQYAFLFRGDSPYGNFPGQYYVPVCIFSEDVEMEFKKDDKTLVPIKIEALEDPDAATEDERFGFVIYQSAAATT